ncbi:fimbrial protein, partial [Burkholderia pseudomallei]
IRNPFKQCPGRQNEALFNSLLRPNDPTSEIKVEPGGAMEHGFALEATVLRVGTAPPTAGTIDATSIITLTIL